MDYEKRIAVVGIVIENRQAASDKVNQILSSYGDMIVGRLGVPYHERNMSVISVIVDGTNDRIGAMTGKLGNITGVRAKVAVTY